MRWRWHGSGLMMLTLAGAAFCQPPAATEGAVAPLPSKTTVAVKTKTATPSPEKSPSAAKSSSVKHHKRTTAAAQANPRKVVVRQGGAVPPPAKIDYGLDPAEAVLDRQDADKSLDYADDKLKALVNRTLNLQQQETAGQIQNYIAGAHVALTEGDLRRANTLALKARLLADDLVRH